MIVIGSRGSALALWQARHIQARLCRNWARKRASRSSRPPAIRSRMLPLAKVGGKGLFTKEIEEALLAGTIDVAVHSMKDVPTEIPAGLTIAAIPEREEARDALVGCSLAELKAGARIGTSSLRRASQLHALRRGLVIETLRGNVDTRLRKLDEGQYDAIVLAAAGLRRLGWQDRIRELIPPEIMCPAVGQGALAIETRDDPGAAWELVRKLDDAAGADGGGSREGAAGDARRRMPGAGGGARDVRRRNHSLARDRGVAGWLAGDRRRAQRNDPAQTGAQLGRTCSKKGRAKSSPKCTRHEGLPGGSGPRRPRPHHPQRPAGAGARRLRALRLSGQRAAARLRSRDRPSGSMSEKSAPSTR